MLGVLAAGGSATYAADATLKASPFWESVQRDVDVSGIVVVGLTTGTLLSGSDLTQLSIRPPRSLAGSEVCLTVQSRDGVYLARNTYILPAQIGGDAINLPYDQSGALDLLRQYDQMHLGISVVEGACQEPTQRFLKPYGPNTAEGSGVNLMVNGFGATDVFYSVSGQNMSGSCDPLRNGRTTVFDFWCHIGLAATQDSPVKIVVERERYGRALPPASFTVAADGH
ncbi:hypothetical protein T31B1_04195 [Salinisphaera sp. T31B1]